VYSLQFVEFLLNLTVLNGCKGNKDSVAARNTLQQNMHSLLFLAELTTVTVQYSALTAIMGLAGFCARY
jgi:hypothetical protein